MKHNYLDIKINDRLYFIDGPKKISSGKAVIYGAEGWIVKLGGLPYIVSGGNYVSHREGKNRHTDHLGHFLND
jgi:hypothetical protein